MSEERLERMERILIWLLWKFTDGENIKKIESAPMMSEGLHKLHIETLNREPDINDIYQDFISSKKKA